VKSRMALLTTVVSLFALALVGGCSDKNVSEEEASAPPPPGGTDAPGTPGGPTDTGAGPSATTGKTGAPADQGE
jgi:hypothetical protein